jgi:hypothetical protein
LFQLQNCVLDLRTNTFRRGMPSDMCRRASPVTLPENWLLNSDIIEAESQSICQNAWEVMWSMYKLVGDHHPDDHLDQLGEQDIPNFHFHMATHARHLEGKATGKCAMYFSKRGRNSKGINEKIYVSVWGEYYVPIKPTVFLADRRNENEHTAAELDRRGARVLFFNEVSDLKWSNAIFKSKNSSDPVVCRGCGDSRVVRFIPTYSFAGGINDPPMWHKTPKGSEKDRITPMYLPNKYIHEGDEATSPRTFSKDTTLEEKVASHDFALGHLLNLVQIRSQVSAAGRTLDEVLGRANSISGHHRPRGFITITASQYIQKPSNPIFALHKWYVKTGSHNTCF